jgi:hypothetical protein
MSTNHELPHTPPPIATIPLGPLWISLLVPPLVTVACNVFIALLGSANRSTVEQFLLAVPLVAAALIIALSFLFYRAVHRRYRGPSLVFLVCAYLLGQVIVCLAFWFGSCLLVLS